MFNLRKVYLSVSIGETQTVVLVAEHNDERVAVLASDTFAHGAMVGCTNALSTAVAIRRFDDYAARLRSCLDGIESRLGFKHSSFLLVLPTGNFEVLADERDRVYTLAGGIVAPADVEKALHAPLDRKNATPCLSIPYNFTLDDEPYAYAPLNRDGSSLMVQRSHYVMSHAQAEPFFNLATALDLSLLRIVPSGLARMHECCDRETLRTGVVGVHVSDAQLALNQVRSGFERSLFDGLPTGRANVLADVAGKLGVSVETAGLYASGIDLYSTAELAVVRTFAEHYSIVSDITVAQVATALRAALTGMLQQLRKALAAKRFGSAFPHTICFTGFFCDLPGFRRLAAAVFGEQCRLLLPSATVVGARGHEFRETLGAVRIMAQLNAVVAAKEYSMEPYDSAELARVNVRKHRVLFAGRMAAKALEGVLGNK